MARNFTFSLAISPSDYQLYYRGTITHVLVTAEGGLRIQFPANLLRAHVTHNGVQGRFCLHVDDAHRAVKLEAINPG